MRLRNLILFLAVFALTFACWAAIGQPAAATAGFCAYQVPLFPTPAGAPDPVAGVSFDTATLGAAEWNGAGGNLATLCAEWVPTIYGTTPPATCEPPLVFFDTDATPGENLYGCTATDTWTQLTGAGGGDITVEEADGAPSIAATSVLQFNQADGFSVVDEGSGQAQVDFALPADSVTAAEMGDADHGQVTWLAGVATVEGLQFGTAFPVSPATGDVFAVTDDSAIGACDSAAGTASTLCRWDGAAWLAVGDGTSGDALGSNIRMYVRDEKPNGTDGGAAVAGWNTRTLNTEVYNAISGASLASNRITLPAGTYVVSARAPAREVDRHRIRLQNITAGVTAAVGSNQLVSLGAPAVATDATLWAIVTPSTTTAYEIQHYIQTATGTADLGNDVTSGDVEVYTEVVVEQIGAGLGAGARASRSTTQAIPTATWTAVTMDAEAWDDGGVFDLATQPTRLSVPAGSGGRWLVVGEAEWSATGSATAVQAAIRQAGVEVASVNVEDFASAGHQVSAVVDAAAGDYFELYVRQDSGVSDDVASAWVAAWCLSCGPGGADGSGGGGVVDGASAIVRVEKSAAQTVASGGFTTLTWQTEIEDASGWRDPGTPNRLVVPTGYDGDYTIGCIAEHATMTAADKGAILQVTVNGVPEARGTHRNPVAAAGTVSATTAVDLVAGDYIECEFSHDDSAALDVVQCGGGNCTTGAPTQLWVRRGGGTNDHGTLVGLADDDHPQYVLDTESPAAGDISGSHSAGYTVVSGAVGVTELGDDATCAANEVVARNAGDTAFECQAAGGVGSASASELLFNNAGSVDGVASSSVSGAEVTLGGDLTVANFVEVTGSAPYLKTVNGSGALALLRTGGSGTSFFNFQGGDFSIRGSNGGLSSMDVIRVKSGADALSLEIDSGEVATFHKRLVIDDQQVNAPATQTCTDSGDASAGFLAVTVTGASFVKLTNADADGCTASLSETGATDGQRLEVVNVSNAGGTFDFSDSAGVQETGAGCSLAVWGAATFRYTTDRWVLTSCEPTN